MSEQSEYCMQHVRLVCLIMFDMAIVLVLGPFVLCFGRYLSLLNNDMLRCVRPSKYQLPQPQFAISLCIPIFWIRKKTKRTRFVWMKSANRIAPLCATNRRHNINGTRSNNFRRGQPVARVWQSDKVNNCDADDDDYAASLLFARLFRRKPARLTECGWMLKQANVYHR